MICAHYWSDSACTRCRKISDIKKTFLHVQLAKQDQHYTYFLWLSKPDDPESKFIRYVLLKIVLFGSVSSPFMLNAALQHLLKADGSPATKDLPQLLSSPKLEGALNPSGIKWQLFPREPHDMKAFGRDSLP